MGFQRSRLGADFGSSAEELIGRFKKKMPMGGFHRKAFAKGRIGGIRKYISIGRFRAVRELATSVVEQFGADSLLGSNDGHGLSMPCWERSGKCATHAGSRGADWELILLIRRGADREV